MRERIRHFSAAALAVAVCFSLASCRDQPSTQGGAGQPAAPAAQTDSASAFDQPRKPSGPVTLKILTNGVSPFWDAMAQGMEAEKKNIEGTVTWQGPNDSSHNGQKQLFEEALAAGVDGIAVSPVEADAFAPVIDSGLAKGVPVITFDSDSAKSKRLAYIGTNNFEAGKRAGEAAVKLFPDGGKLVAFVGNMSAQNARDRFDGFKEAIKGTKIEFLQDPFEDNKDVGRARQNVAEAITKFGNQINGLVGLYSYNGPAIVDEVVKSNIRSRVKIICFDGEPKTLSNLEKGLVDVTVVQKPYEFGRLATRLLYLINRKGFRAAMEEMKPELETAGMKVENNIIDTGVAVITPANAAPFLQRLKDMGLTST